MKKLFKSFAAIALAACVAAGSLCVYTGVSAVSVYAEEALELNCSSGGMQATNAAVSDGKYEVRFTAPGYQNINAIKNAGFTKLEISYEISAYTANGAPGVQPFVTFDKTWDGEWNDLKSSTGSVDKAFDSSWDDGKNQVYFGVQFTNITGTISYKITSARLVKDGSSGGSSSSGGSQAGNTVEDVNGEVELNYAKLLQESLYFYDANMCGSDVDENSLFSWRSDCHTDDARAVYNGKTIDVSGGYHDAGDHVKFGLPAAFAASMLGVSYLEYKSAYDDLGQTAHYKRIMDRFADYFERCTVMENGKVQAFCYQVGEGNQDHGFGGIPEDQTGERPVYFTSASDPCTDIVCQTAAALALYSINFNDERSLEYAKALFEYADSGNKGVSKGRDGKFYDSGDYKDEYAFAAAILYKATGDNKYKAAYNSINNSGGLYCGWPASWDDVKSLAVLYSPNGGAANDSVSNYVNDKANYAKKSDGYVNVDGWGSARYNASLQFIGLLSDRRMGTDQFGSWAEGQMSYLLGNNSGKHCFVVGYNQFSVKNPHHRAVYGVSSFPNGCQNNAKHILLGALVGGPGDMASNYTDDVNDYCQNEVALDYNACLVCAAASLYTYKAEKGTDEEKALQKTVDVSQISGIELRTLANTVKGDADGDGGVDDTDVRLVIKHISDLQKLSDAKNADMNNDGKIDMLDVILMLNNK